MGERRTNQHIFRYYCFCLEGLSGNLSIWNYSMSPLFLSGQLQFYPNQSPQIHICLNSTRTLWKPEKAVLNKFDCHTFPLLSSSMDSIAFMTEIKIFTRAWIALSGLVPAEFFNHILFHSLFCSAPPAPAPCPSITGFLCFMPHSEPLKCCSFFLRCYFCFSLSLS